MPDHPQYFVEHCRRLDQHLPIVEAQDAYSARGEKRGSSLIVRLALRFHVLRPIDLDHQPRCRRVEVDDVAPDRSLPVELHALYLLSAKARPEAALGVGHRVSQLASEMLQSG